MPPNLMMSFVKLIEKKLGQLAVPYATICKPGHSDAMQRSLSFTVSGAVRLCAGVVVAILDPGTEENLCKMSCFIINFVYSSVI